MARSHACAAAHSVFSLSVGTVAPTALPSADFRLTLTAGEIFIYAKGDVAKVTKARVRQHPVFVRTRRSRSRRLRQRDIPVCVGTIHSTNKVLLPYVPKRPL